MLCCKLEVIEFRDNEHRKVLFDLAKRCQEATNYFWQQWELFHVQNDSATKIKAHLEAFARWRETNNITKPQTQRKSSKQLKIYRAALIAWCRDGRKAPEPQPPVGLDAEDAMATRNYTLQLEYRREHDMPKLDCDPLSKELSKAIRRRGMAAAFPDLNSRVRELLANKLEKLVRNKKAATGSLPGWQAILLCQEGRPSSIHPAPIPFDHYNARLSIDDGGDIWLGFRLDRDDKAEGEKKPSHLFSVKLKTKGRAARYAAPIRAIAEGMAKLSGATVQYDTSRKKWFVSFTYTPPPMPRTQLEAEKKAFLRAAATHPFGLRIDGRTHWVGGSGRHIGNRRRGVIEGRWSRQENYRTATRNRKGHGRKTALENVKRLEKSWRGFCKTFNETAASEAIQKCLNSRCGKLVMFAPRGARFLEVTGKNPYRNDSSSWPWHSLYAFLERKCARLGIEFVLMSQRVKKKARD